MTVLLSTQEKDFVTVEELLGKRRTYWKKLLPQERLACLERHVSYWVLELQDWERWTHQSCVFNSLYPYALTVNRGPVSGRKGVISIWYNNDSRIRPQGWAPTGLKPGRQGLGGKSHLLKASAVLREASRGYLGWTREASEAASPSEKAKLSGHAAQEAASKQQGCVCLKVLFQTRDDWSKVVVWESRMWVSSSAVFISGFYKSRRQTW